MARKRYKPEEIVGKLRQAEPLLGQGLAMAEAIRQFGSSEVTFYRCPARRASDADRAARSEADGSGLRGNRRVEAGREAGLEGVLTACLRAGVSARGRGGFALEPLLLP